MADIASLGIKIDTSDVQKAEGDLDKLARAGANAEQSANKTGAAWAQVGAKMGQAAAPAAKVADAFKQGSESIKAQQTELAALIGKIDPVAGALGRLDDQLSKLRKFKTAGLLDADSFKDYSAKIESARRSLSAADIVINKTGVSAGQTANALRQLPAQFTDIFTSLAGGQNPLLVLIQQGGQIKDSFGGIGNTFQALKDQMRGLFSSAANVDADGVIAFGEGLAEIAAQQSAVAQSVQPASEGLGDLAEGANSAAETAGNARAAIGGLGISAGVTVGLFVAAAAAAAALALAYKQGSDEASAYTKAIILTGNAAGTSADSLGSMAEAVGGSTSTIGAAADALNQLASTGKIAEAQLSSLATAAVNFNEATGKAISETVAEFAKLADDPVRASESLNQQYNYLTAAVYEQIQALQEQGDKAGAAALAEESYAQALNVRASDIEKSLGSIESAWDAVGLGARQAWDSMLGIGREQTLDAKIAELKAKLAEIDSSTPALQASRERFGGPKRSEVAGELLTNELQKAQNDGEAARAAFLAKTNKEGIAALRELDAQRESSATKEEKHAKELEAYAKRKAAILAANPLSTQFANGQDAKDIAAIDAKYAEKEVKARKPRAEKAAPVYRDDAATKMLQSLREQGAALNEQLTTTGKLTQAEQAQVKFAQLIADLKTKDILTADQKSLLLNQDSIKAQLDKNAAVAGEVAQRDALNKLQERSAQIQASIKSASSAANDANQTELSSIGKGSKQRAQDKDTRAISKEFQRYQEQLNRAADNGTLDSEAYKQGTKDIEDQLDERLKAQKKHYKDLDKAQGNWQNGANEAFQDYIDNAKDIAGSTKDIISGTMDALTNGIADSFATAIVQGDDLRTSLSNVALAIETELLSGLIKLGAQYVINAITAETVGTGATAASIAMAGTTAAAWAPAAALASLASFGANAVPAATAITTTTALASSMTLAGFEAGGYTGSGGTKDIAGVVHGQEYVLNASTTRRIGVDNLDAMQSGKIVNIGTPMAAGQGTTAAPAQSAAPVTVSNHFDMRGMSGPAAREASGSIARKVSGAVGRAGRYS